MSNPVHERLRQLESEVQDLRVLPAAAVRARGRRRARRQMAAVTTGVAVVATTAGITATQIFDRPDRDATPPAAAGPAVGCVLTLPDSPAQIHVRVLEGGAPAGQGETTAAQLRERGFTVLTPGDAPAGPTTLRYGPAAIGAATVLRAVVVGAATMQFDPARTDDTIDLTLGTTFDRLGTTTEINQALVTAGEPTAPPGC
jgi:hypothetical protein